MNTYVFQPTVWPSSGIWNAKVSFMKSIVKVSHPIEKLKKSTSYCDKNVLVFGWMLMCRFL
jgi:hypothetical protein